MCWKTSLQYVMKYSVALSIMKVKDLSNWRANTKANWHVHYSDVIMGTIASQITSLTIVYSTVYSDADQREYQSSESLAFMRGVHRRPVNFPHKWPVTWKMFPFDDVFMDMPPYRFEPGLCTMTIRNFFLDCTLRRKHFVHLWCSTHLHW